MDGLVSGESWTIDAVGTEWVNLPTSLQNKVSAIAIRGGYGCTLEVANNDDGTSWPTTSRTATSWDRKYTHENSVLDAKYTDADQTIAHYVCGQIHLHGSLDANRVLVHAPWFVYYDPQKMAYAIINYH